MILGADLVWRDGRFVSGCAGVEGSGVPGKNGADFDVFVRNVYPQVLDARMVEQ